MLLEAAFIEALREESEVAGLSWKQRNRTVYALVTGFLAGVLLLLLAYLVGLAMLQVRDLMHDFYRKVRKEMVRRDEAFNKLLDGHALVPCA